MPSIDLRGFAAGKKKAYKFPLHKLKKIVKLPSIGLESDALRSGRNWTQLKGKMLSRNRGLSTSISFLHPRKMKEILGIGDKGEPQKSALVL